MPKPKKKTAKKTKTKSSEKKSSRKSVKRTKSQKKKPQKAAAKAVNQRKKVAPSLGLLIGKVTHYFPHVNAAVVKIDTGEVRVGDQLHFKGHTTDFKQKLASMQINRAPINRATVGDEIGIEVKSRVREGDDVYKP